MRATCKKKQKAYITTEASTLKKVNCLHAYVRICLFRKLWVTFSLSVAMVTHWIKFNLLNILFLLSWWYSGSEFYVLLLDRIYRYISQFFCRIFSCSIFFFFFQKPEFGISCKLSPKETICIKCQTLFCDVYFLIPVFQEYGLTIPANWLLRRQLEWHVKSYFLEKV